MIVPSDSDARLVCTALFPYLNSSWDIWWTVDGKRLDKLFDQHRFSRTNRWREELIHYTGGGGKAAQQAYW